MSKATVVQGEASESDDEPEIVESFKNITDGRFGVRVAGEASESEDEVEDELPALVVNVMDEGSVNGEDKSVEYATQNSITSDNPKYDTLLHKKLKEKNKSFHKHSIEMATQTYTTAAKNISNTTQQLWKLQSTVQDVSYNMRSLTNDLFYLEDRIDIIATCNLLPNLNI